MKRVTIRNEETLSLWNAIVGCRDLRLVPKAVKFALALTRRKIQDHVEILIEQQEEHRRVQGDLAERYAERDGEGQPIRTDRGFKIDPLQRKAYFEAIDKADKDLKTLMKATTKIDVSPISFATLPEENDLSTAQLDGLWPMLTHLPTAGDAETDEPKEPKALRKVS